MNERWQSTRRRRTANAARSATLFAILAATIVSLGGLATARDRPLEMLLVNMAPARTRPECLRDVQRAWRRERPNVTRLGSERLRQLAGRGATAFTDWRAEDVDPAIQVLRTERIDAVVLVDCRPEEGRANVWVRSPSRGVSSLSLRNTTIDADRAEWIGRWIATQAWMGFAPSR